MPNHQSFCIFPLKRCVCCWKNRLLATQQMICCSPPLANVFVSHPDTKFIAQKGISNGHVLMHDITEAINNVKPISCYSHLFLHILVFQFLLKRAHYSEWWTVWHLLEGKGKSLLNVVHAATKWMHCYWGGANPPLSPNICHQG